MQQVKTENLLNLEETIAADLFAGKTYPWEVLPEIKDFILKLGPTLDESRYKRLADDIWVAKSARIYESAHLSGPLIIDEDSEVRHGAFIRGSVIVGKNCVVGNSVELKNCILFNHVDAPHYNYVGDSVLGFHAHMGAGAIASNLKSDKTNIVVKNGEQEIETGLRKFATILGDFAEIGAHTVLNPGSVVGRYTMIYPNSTVRGVVAPGSIYKSRQSVEVAKNLNFE